MNADEAKRMAYHVNQTKEAIERNAILSVIEKAAKDGLYFINVDSISCSLIDLLKFKGYTVTVNNHYNELSVTISWK